MIQTRTVAGRPAGNNLAAWSSRGKRLLLLRLIVQRQAISPHCKQAVEHEAQAT
ncbi:MULTISPECIES: hypothetical protein [Enterobacteriaceae]|uniref:hypothetical protein n=1 Tax=Enterobacteriaceae TaxID=543 RepID=UPI001643B8B1|nr:MULTISPECIES: hypothetical protein [Enterobacteriaceae]